MFQVKTWLDRVSEYPTRRILTDLNGNSEVYTVTRNEGTVSQEGDAFSAANMNDLEARILAAIAPLGEYLGSFNISSGSSSYVITNEIFLTSSLVDVYVNDDDVETAEDAGTDFVLANGSLTITFTTPLAADITIENIHVVNASAVSNNNS